MQYACHIYVHNIWECATKREETEVEFKWNEITNKKEFFFFRFEGESFSDFCLFTIYTKTVISFFCQSWEWRVTADTILYPLSVKSAQIEKIFRLYTK